MSTKVSIIIPTRDRVKLLPQSVASCLAQTFNGLEVVIVDDASSDGTGDWVRSQKDPRIVYIRQDQQRGMAASLNTGFKAARGQYLTWTSDDDYYSSTDALRIMTDFLDVEPTVDFVYAHYDRVDETGKFIGEARVEEPPLLDRDNYVGHCFLYRRGVYEAVGDYSPEAFLIEDYDYWLRVRERFVMKRIPERLYSHRMHPQSLTMTYRVEQVQAMVAKARKKYIPAWKQHFFLAETHYHARRRIKAAGNAAWSLVLNPCQRDAWRILALNVLPSGLVTGIRGH